jgi:hypothetical protein
VLCPPLALVVPPALEVLAPPFVTLLPSLISRDRQLDTLASLPELELSQTLLDYGYLGIAALTVQLKLADKRHRIHPRPF